MEKKQKIYIVAIIGAIAIIAAAMLIINAKPVVAASPISQVSQVQSNSAELMVCPEPDYTQCQMEYNQADCRALLCKPNKS